MSEIKTHYRGFDIVFSEFNESWSCELSRNKSYEKEKMSDVKKRIDKFIKDESEFKNMEVVVLGNGYRNIGFTKMTITSIADNGEAWVKDEKGNRQKLYKGTAIYKISDSNSHLITCHAENLSKISALQDENETIRDETMETLDVSKNAMEDK